MSETGKLSEPHLDAKLCSTIFVAESENAQDLGKTTAKIQSNI